MTYSITKGCVQCHSCVPECPTGAIKDDDDGFWIDPLLCNRCEGYYPEPQCVSHCPIEQAHPIPLQAKKGRLKAQPKIATSPPLFPNGKTHPFASSIVVWEACNILAQRQSLPWERDAMGKISYHRQVNGGRGKIIFGIAAAEEPSPPMAGKTEAASAEIANWDIRAACLHLIYAAYAIGLDKPWEDSFTISDQQISDYLGLEKRKDLSKLTKLTLIKELVEQPCRLEVSIDWAQQGRVRGITLEASRLWHLVSIQYSFQEDDQGCKHLSGLTFEVKAGEWAKYFLNQQGSRQNTAFYQYGNLPKSLLQEVMSIWQQHEGAARIMLWLLFKTRIGVEQRIMIATLMRIAYGEEKVSRASSHREERKRLLRTFESDLEMLNHLGLKPVFDPVTYPPEIQPLWARLLDLPDDAEAALEFWTTDGSHETRLTDAAPRDKWNRLIYARLLQFELPPDWIHRTPKSTKKRSKKAKSDRSIPVSTLSGQQIAAARKSCRLSQRDLANQLGKSQSWVRDIESGRLHVNEKDRARLSELLGISRGR